MSQVAHGLPPTLDLKGAADMLKIHPQSMLDLIGSCAIPAGKVGRSYVMLTRDVLAYAEKVIIEETAARMRRAAPLASDLSLTPRTRGRRRVITRP